MPNIHSMRLILLLTLCLFTLLIASCTQNDGSLEIEGGQITGIPGEDPIVTVYKGVPFAAPPLGELRWQPPQAPASWEGVMEANTFSDACVQNLQRSRPPWTEEFMHQGDADEDCLYLNIWTTARSGDELPVLVYIHGGGFGEGSGSIDVYDGEALAKKNLVVVTINYRLGVLGFLSHPELTAASPDQTSGNYGMLDQVAALEWVQKNIEAFGGDPDNVTIAGQSAGAMSVYLLTASPLARGLIHRAIVQSGPGGLASFGLTSSRGMAQPLEEAQAEGVRFAEAVGASSLSELRSLSVEALTDLGEDQPQIQFRPIIDGHFLPEDMSDIYAKGNQNDVPMMSGYNADEASAFPGYRTMTLAQVQGMASQRYGDLANQFLEVYDVTSDELASQAHISSMRDLAAVAIQNLAAARAATARTPEYLYYFERGIPWPEYPDFGAFHTGEVPYVFNTLHKLDRPWESLDRELAETTSSYWANFAANGDPNGPGLPQWPAFTPEASIIMVLGANSGPVDMPAEDTRRELFEQILTQ